MRDRTARTFSSDFKRFFLRGLVFLLPTVLTLWIVVKAYQFVNSAIAEPINGSVRLMMANASPYWGDLQEKFAPTADQLEAARAAPNARDVGDDVLIARLRAENIAAWWAERWYMNLIGLGVAIIAVYIAGHLLGGFLGKRLYRYSERFIISLPVFKQVYPYVKQIVDFLFSDDRKFKFNRVVLAEYPRKGSWSLGFLTGGTIRAIEERSAGSVTVFVPSAPTPFTGYTITLPRDEVIEIPMTVEEAIRYIVSGGVLIPDHQFVPVNHALPNHAPADAALSTDSAASAANPPFQKTLPPRTKTVQEEPTGR